MRAGPPGTTHEEEQEQPAQGMDATGPAMVGGEMGAHIQCRGDVRGALGQWMGEPGSRVWVEGFGILPTGLLGAADIEYQAVLGKGWLSPWMEGGDYCGSRGMALPVLGLAVRLKGDAARRFLCRVRASFTDGTRAGPVDAGVPVASESLAPLEAFLVEILPISTDATLDDAGPTEGASADLAALLCDDIASSPQAAGAQTVGTPSTGEPASAPAKRRVAKSRALKAGAPKAGRVNHATAKDRRQKPSAEQSAEQAGIEKKPRAGKGSRKPTGSDRGAEASAVAPDVPRRATARKGGRKADGSAGVAAVRRRAGRGQA
ncbi:hypothetical protein K2X14_10040 [Acetobacter sp. TBRC 12305]|nr:hypothetical protein [Acetobacter garciniae]